MTDPTRTPPRPDMGQLDEWERDAIFAADFRLTVRRWAIASICAIVALLLWWLL